MIEFPTPTIKMSLVREVTPPARAHTPDAGIDFYVPTNIPTKDYNYCNSMMSLHSKCKSKITIKNGIIASIELDPNCRTLIPSGVKADIPVGWSLIFFNKSGVCTKKGLMAGGCVVDSGYQGEIHLSLFNNSPDTIVIEAGEKILQGILLPVATVNTEIVPLDQLYSCESTRGDGGFGSTNGKLS